MFSDYLIPAMVLAIAVGGSAIGATILLIKRHAYAKTASLLAALAIVVFESVEVLVIGSPEGIARNLQTFYFALGAFSAILSLRYVPASQQSPQQVRKVVGDP